MEVAAGTTVRLTLGGTGRPVVGKAVLPAELAGRDDWHLRLLLPEPQADRRGGPGRGAGRPRAESCVFKVEPDGSFRIEDVEAGTYEILIMVNKRPAEGRRARTEVLASVRREVVVPRSPAAGATSRSISARSPSRP